MIYYSQVVEHICSYKRDESHYAREKTRDRQFLECNLSIAKLWRDFLQNKGDVPLSYSTFRRIFRKFKLSFKRPSVDTCGKCDSLLVVIKYSQDEEEIKNAKELKENHIKQAEERYDYLHFDLNILPESKNTEDDIPSTLPPTWK